MNEEALKICSNCERISSKPNLQNDLSERDGLKLICKICRIGHFNEKFEQKLEYQKIYNRQNRVKKLSIRKKENKVM